MNDATPDLRLQLEAKVKHNVFLEDGDQQHDAEPCEHAQVLQDKVTHLTALVLLTVTMKHLWHLKNKKNFILLNRRNNILKTLSKPKNQGLLHIQYIIEK